MKFNSLPENPRWASGCVGEDRVEVVLLKNFNVAPGAVAGGFTKVSTYQVLDIQIEGNRLHYRAYDVDGKVRDEFVIEK